MKLLLSLLLTVASLSAFAQQTIKISGRVTDFNDKPIILMLDYNVRHDDRFVHKIRITAENVKYHERGENICFFQNSDCR